MISGIHISSEVDYERENKILPASYKVWIQRYLMSVSWSLRDQHHLFLFEVKHFIHGRRLIAFRIPACQLMATGQYGLSEACIWPAKFPLYSLQALKYVHTPQTDGAWFGVDVTILLKVAALDVVAQGKIAIETERIIIAEDVLPERDEMGIIPYLQNAPCG